MEGKPKFAALQGLCLTTQQWREVEQELIACLREHQITAAQYRAAMSEVKCLRDAQPAR